jgi:predicted RNA-binding protein with PUA-like domain
MFFIGPFSSVVNGEVHDSDFIVRFCTAGGEFVLARARASLFFAAMPQHWMVKQEPTTYAWAQFVKDKGSAWTGVRNFQARNNLRAMKKGDLVLYYHSVVGKEVVGIAKVAKTAYPDPTADEEGWECVDLVPVKALASPVTLDTIKATPKLAKIALLRQSRLSVMPLLPEEYECLLHLSNGE